jgi:hypothetical protein
MSLARKFVVVVVTGLLVTTLVTGNLLAAAHLTVLDPGFVQNAVEEEGGYEIVENATVEAASSQVSAEAGDLVDTEALLREGIDQQYLANQTERNVDALYAYLHGDADTLNLTVDTEPLKAGLSSAVEEQVRNATVAELLAQSDAELDGPINESTVQRMTENESSYEAVKTDFRERIRSEVIDEVVEQAWQETSNDEKLALVIPDYDPRDYTEAEKERMVADNETEIRTALRERAEDEQADEIDQRVETSLVAINESVAPAGSDEEGIEAATADMQATFAEGLTTDMPYQEFRSDLDAAKADAAATVGDRVESQLDEQLPDTFALTDDMDPQTRESLATAQTAVTWLDRLAIVLPLVALALVGLLYYATRSLQTVAASLGVSLAVAGLPIYLSLGYLNGLVEQTVTQNLAAGGGVPQPVVDLMLGLVGQLFGRVGAVSLAFAVGGIVLLVGWLALRYDVLDRGDDRTAAEAAAAADAEAMAESESGDAAGDDTTDDAATPAAGPSDGAGGDPLADRGDEE